LQLQWVQLQFKRFALQSEWVQLQFARHQRSLIVSTSPTCTFPSTARPRIR
jgi:hypothetical protein